MVTYPDRESRPDRFYLIFAVVFVMLVYLAFAAEASFRRDVCISAAQVDLSGSVTTTPVICR